MERIVDRAGGLDVHKDVIVAEVHLPGGVVEQGRFATTTPGLLVLRDWLVAHGVTRVGMESTGVYWKPPYYLLEDAMEVWLLNARHMRNIPGRKTDRRDARRMARLLHIGEITGIRVPTVVEEDARDLFRARDDARVDVMRARHRLSKLLLRHGIVYCGGKAWNGVHERWLRSQRFELPGTTAAFDAAFDAVLSVTARRDRLDEAIVATAARPQWAPVVARLGAIRGIATLTGFGLAVEIGDWDRFTGASIGAYLGLVPSESSSGASRHQGPITKTGNTHARRLLVEAAWHHQRLLRPAGKAVALRRAGLSPAVRARGQAADRRLRRRWMALQARNKEPSVIAVAVARELAGWCWSLATMDG
jgi:transposase